MPTFHVGQKVVCINDRFKNVSIDQGIRKGQVYTVRWAGHTATMSMAISTASS